MLKLQIPPAPYVTTADTTCTVCNNCTYHLRCMLKLQIPPALNVTTADTTCTVCNHNFITVFKTAATGTYPEPHKSTDIIFFSWTLDVV
jgi:hypothetical protein